MRGFVSALVALLVVAGVMWLPTPYFLLTPGETPAVEEVISLSGVPHREQTGKIHILTVAARRARVGTMFAHVWSNKSAIIHEKELLPADEPFQDYVAASKLLMEESQRLALHAALNRQNQTVQYTGRGARVVSSWTMTIPKDSVIVAWQGQSVYTAADLERMWRQWQADDRPVQKDEKIQVEVLLPGVDIPTSVTFIPLKTHFGFALPFQVVTENPALSVSDDLRVIDDRIGGSSAGLAMALYLSSVLADRDWLQGRTIAATGTIDADGYVGPVGSLSLKWLAARQIDADIMFIPYSERDLLNERAGEGPTVVPVESLDEAIDYLLR